LIIFLRFGKIANMKTIAEQLEIFFASSAVTPAQLSRESGVHEVRISVLRSGKQKDVYSATADAMRQAMRQLDPEAAKKALG
jgi:hypothetical protein